MYAHLVDEHERDGNQNMWLLGDSGYPVQPWLMTPVSNPRTDQEKMYNKLHAKTRSKVERCIGVLKNRFRCLLGERKLLYNHERASNIIVSCVVLHNFLNSHGEIETAADNSDNHDNSPSTDNTCTNYGAEGRIIRNHLIQSLSNN